MSETYYAKMKASEREKTVGERIHDLVHGTDASQAAERARIRAMLRSEEARTMMERRFYEFLGCTDLNSVQKNSRSFAAAALSAIEDLIGE